MQPMNSAFPQGGSYTSAFDQFLIPDEAMVPNQQQQQQQHQHHQQMNQSKPSLGPAFFSSAQSSVSPPFPQHQGPLKQNQQAQPHNVVNFATANAYTFDDIVDDGDDEMYQSSQKTGSKKGPRNIFTGSTSSLGSNKGEKYNNSTPSFHNNSRNSGGNHNNNSNRQHNNNSRNTKGSSHQTRSASSGKKGLFGWGRKKDLRDDFNGDDDDFDGFSMVNEQRFESPHSHRSQGGAGVDGIDGADETDSMVGGSRYSGANSKYPHSGHNNFDNFNNSNFQNNNFNYNAQPKKPNKDEVEGALDIGMNQLASLRDRDRYGGIERSVGASGNNESNDGRAMSLRSMTMTHTSFDTTPIIPMLTTSLTNGVSEKNNKYRQRVANNQLKMLKEEVGANGVDSPVNKPQVPSGPMPLGGMGLMGPSGPGSPGSLDPLHNNQGQMRRATGTVNTKNLPNGGRSMTMSGYPHPPAPMMSPIRNQIATNMSQNGLRSNSLNSMSTRPNVYMQQMTSSPSSSPSLPQPNSGRFVSNRRDLSGPNQHVNNPNSPRVGDGNNFNNAVKSSPVVSNFGPGSNQPSPSNMLVHASGPNINPTSAGSFLNNNNNNNNNMFFAKSFGKNHVRGGSLANGTASIVGIQSTGSKSLPASPVCYPVLHRSPSFLQSKPGKLFSSSSSSQPAMADDKILHLSLQNAALLDEVRLVTMELAESVQRELSSSSSLSSSPSSLSSFAIPIPATDSSFSSTTSLSSAESLMPHTQPTSPTSTTVTTPIKASTSTNSKTTDDNDNHNSNTTVVKSVTVSNDPDSLAMDHMTRAKLVIQLESMLDVERRKCKALEDHINDTSSTKRLYNVVDLESQVAKQQHDLLEAKLSLETLESDHSILKKTHFEQSQLLADLQAAANAERLEAQQISQKLAEKEELLQKLEFEISDKDVLLQDNKQAHENELSHHVRQLKTLETQLAEQESSVQSLIQGKEQEKSALSAQVSQLQSLLKEREQEINDLSAEKTRQDANEQSTIETANSELAKLKEENKALHNELSAFRSLPPGVGVFNINKSAAPTPSADRDLNSVASSSVSLPSSISPSTAAQLGPNKKPLTPRDEKILAIEGQRDALREALRSQRERKDHEIKTLSERVRQLEHRLEKEKNATISAQQKLFHLPSSNIIKTEISPALGLTGSSTAANGSSNSSNTHSINANRDKEISPSPTLESFSLTMPPRRRIIKHSNSFYNLQPSLGSPITYSSISNNSQLSQSPNTNSTFGGSMSSFNSFSMGSFNNPFGGNSRPSSRGSSIIDHHEYLTPTQTMTISSGSSLHMLPNTPTSSLLNNDSIHQPTASSIPSPASISNMYNNTHHAARARPPVLPSSAGSLPNANLANGLRSRSTSPVPFSLGLPAATKSELTATAVHYGGPTTSTPVSKPGVSAMQHVSLESSN